MNQFASKQYRSGGKFAKHPSLETQGYPIATGKSKCANCGHEWLPILKTAPCEKCRSTDKK
jgi:predicted Zn-ribbon and HTH transcriptional regulator